MRRLAALDRDPMIPYRHAANKAALLDGVAETVLAQLKADFSDPDQAAWLRAVARNYRQLATLKDGMFPLVAYPGGHLGQLVTDDRPEGRPECAQVMTVSARAALHPA